MIKVMFFIRDLEVGGAQMMVLNLMSYLIRMDELEIKLVVLKKDNHGFLSERVKELGVNVTYLSKKNGFQPSIMYKIYHEIKIFQPDIIHEHLPDLHYIVFPAKVFRVPRIYHTVHNMAAMESGNRWVKGFMKFAFLNCEVIPVAISEICRKSISEEYGYPQEKIPCIPVGINTERFIRIQGYMIDNTNPIRFLAIGRMEKQKNYDMMISVFYKIYLEYKNVTLTILGDGKLRKHLEDLIYELNMKEVVSMPGIVADTKSYLDCSDIFIMSSNYEGFPQVLLEAASCSLPIVSTDVGGVSEIVHQNRNGLLVEPENEDKFYEACKWLIDNPDKRVEYANSSRKIGEIYNIELCAKKHLNLYLKNDREERNEKY